MVSPFLEKPLPPLTSFAPPFPSTDIFLVLSYDSLYHNILKCIHVIVLVKIIIIIKLGLDLMNLCAQQVIFSRVGYALHQLNK